MNTLDSSLGMQNPYRHENDVDRGESTRYHPTLNSLRRKFRLPDNGRRRRSLTVARHKFRLGSSWVSSPAVSYRFTAATGSLLRNIRRVSPNHDLLQYKISILSLKHSPAFTIQRKFSLKIPIVVRLYTLSQLNRGLSTPQCKFYFAQFSQFAMYCGTHSLSIYKLEGF